MTTIPNDLVGGSIWWAGWAVICHWTYHKPIKKWQRAAFVVGFSPIFAMLVNEYFDCFASIESLPFYFITVGASVYGAMLFVLLDEVMMLGLALQLTRWLGDKWVERLGYMNIVLGGLGVAFTINHLEPVEKTALLPDYYWPFVLASALVLAAVQLRVKIGNWHVVR